MAGKDSVLAQKSTILLLACLACLTGAALALHTPGAGNLDDWAWPWFEVIAVAQAIVWGLLVREILRGRVALRVGLAVAIVLRLILIPVAPFLSSDVNRYVWDGVVQRSGVNPYLYVPADPALAQLRGAEVYTHINRADTAPTIYPPAAQMVFAAAAFVAPGVIGMKALMVGFEALAVVCLMGLLRAMGRPVAWVLIYALSPLALWSFAGNGHVDAVAIGLLCAAMLAAARWRPGAAGVLFGAAVLTKFLPVVVFPALWRGRGGRLPVLAAATVVVMYGVYLGAGSRVLGFLPGYGAEEGLTTGAGIWLLAGLRHLGALPAWSVAAYATALALVLLAVAAHILRRAPLGLIGADAALLAAAVTVGVSPHYPWYFAWLAALAVLRPEPWLLWLAGSAMLLHYDPFADAFVLPCLIYLPALGLALFGLRPVSSPLVPEQAT